MRIRPVHELLWLSLLVAVALRLSAAGIAGGSAGEPDPAVVHALGRFLERAPVIHEYRGTRRLEASGYGQSAWLDARTDFTAASGLTYEVTAEGGNRFIRSRVLKSLLDEEQRLIASRGGPTVAISPVNYRFEPRSLNADGLAVVDMTPLRKERALIDGRIFLSPADGELLRIEGRLARTPSFWVSRVDIVRSYEPVNGVLLPVSLETTAQLRLFGSSSLRMTYHYTIVDNEPVVGTPAEGGHESAPTMN